MNEFGLGANKSPFDLRTFTYTPSVAPVKGGKRYPKENIEHQHKVGICTAISLTQNARRALGTKFSADFQYLCQKKFYDGDWNEGSAISSALKVAKNIGLLPSKDFKYIKESDRKLPYHLYVEKLKAIPDAEIEKLKKKAAKNKILAFAEVPVDRDSLANAIMESESGILARFHVGKEWYTQPIEPLRYPKLIISGHAVTESNFDGGSFRIANSWGSGWADGGTAYHTFNFYRPTEAWIAYYTRTTPEIDKQLEDRKKLMGVLIDKLQLLLDLTK